MNEVQRQAALAAMGIDSWFPRYVLPAAAPSHPCEWPEELPLRARTRPVPPGRPDAAAPDTARAERPAHTGVAREALSAGLKSQQVVEPSAPAAIPTPSTNPAPVASPAREALAQGFAEPVRKAPVTTAAAPTARATEESAPVRFRLAFVRCGPVAVLNQLPYLGRESLGAAPRQLFLNLARALGWPPESVQVREESFRWPFAETMTMDADSARLALRAYVEHMAGESPFRALLVLGGQLAPFVLPADWDGAGETGRLLRAPELPWPVLLSRSLDELLSLPTLKRQVWRDLAPLAAFVPDA